MKGARAVRFGSTNLSTNHDLPQPETAVGQLLVRDCPQINNPPSALGQPNPGLTKSAST